MGVDLEKNLDEQFKDIVRVSEFGGEERTLGYAPETTVAQYLARGGIETPLAKGLSVSVNGQVVKDLNTPVDPNSVVVVVGNIANG